MDAHALATLRMILHAAARVLGCGSVHLALIDREQDALVIRVAVSNEDAQRFERAESLMGVAADGLTLPFHYDRSALVRAVREARIVVTTRFADLAGGFLPDEAEREIQSIVGHQTFAAVPVTGREGALAVLLFVKPGESGFAPADRDLLVAYAEHVGAALEAEATAAELDELDSSGDIPVQPPSIVLCDVNLRLAEGDRQPLEELLRATGAAAKLHDLAARPGDGARAINIQADDGRPLRISLRPLPAPATGFFVVVDELLWADRLLREVARARQHLSRVLGSVRDAVFTLDGLGTIVGCNKAARALFDSTHQGLIGRPIIDLLVDARTRSRAEEMTRRLADAGYVEFELRFLREGRALPAAVSALLLADDRGQPTGSLWSVRDLSARRRGDAERKRLRERLLRSERLSALGEMAARIAHEVRNPLVSIGAAAQVIVEELGPGSTVKPEALAIAREVRRLDSIVSGFLHVARPHGMDAPRPPRRSADVRRLVDETVELLRPHMPGLTLTVAGGDACVARCDPDGIHQVLWNVLRNAVEASPPGGTVSCEVKRRDDLVSIAISDEGPGIPAKVRRRLFDPFFSTKARGTGLGLVISREVLEQHGGRLRLLSRPKGGTRAVIELPAEQRAEGIESHG